MTNVYLIRHGQSQANVAGLYQGQTYDTDLSDHGQTQARLLAERFQNLTFDAIYVSPLKRAHQTAQNLMGKKIIDHQIKETHHGDWDGHTEDDINLLWPGMLTNWRKSPKNIHFPNGEKFTETFNRAINWFNSLDLSHQNIAVITHENIIQCLLVYVLKKDLNSIHDFKIHQTSVSLIQVASPPKVIYWGDIYHLKDIK